MSKQRQSTRVVVTCEHASRAIPRELREALRTSSNDLEEHRFWDPGAPGIARQMANRLGAPCFSGRCTRLVVDLNRSLHHPALHGWAVKRMPAKTREALILRYHTPFRRQVKETVDRFLAQGYCVLHLSVHSFVPILDGVPRNTDFALLYDPVRRREKCLSSRWLSQLRTACPQWRLRRNHPYRGSADGHTTSLRRIYPASQYMGIELEFCQSLPLVRKSGGIGRLMAGVVQALLAQSP